MNCPFKAVEIEINHACNMACSYCPNSVEKRVEKGVMPLEQVAHIFKELAAIGFSGRVSPHFYNEPLVHPKFKEIVKLSKEILPKSPFVVHSNGSLLDKEKLRELIKVGVDKFIITEHEEGQKNFNHFQNIMNDLGEEDLSKVVFQKYSDISLFNRGGVIPEVGDTVNTNLLPCEIPANILTITVKGNVLPCFEDFRQELVMGNIFEQKLLSIWENEKYSQFRKDLKYGLRHKYDICKSCNRTEVLFSK